MTVAGVPSAQMSATNAVIRGMCTGGLVQVGLAALDAENVRSGLGEGNRGSTADPGSRILLR
jgi:hypothetical protein